MGLAYIPKETEEKIEYQNRFDQTGSSAAYWNKKMMDRISLSKRSFKQGVLALARGLFEGCVIFTGSLVLTILSDSATTSSLISLGGGFLIGACGAFSGKRTLEKFRESDRHSEVLLAMESNRACDEAFTL